MKRERDTHHADLGGADRLWGGGVVAVIRGGARGAVGACKLGMESMLYHPSESPLI